jgi:hypothetical protein
MPTRIEQSQDTLIFWGMGRMAVAVLCARNRRNSGMYSVDLAAQQFFNAIGIPYSLCRSQDETKFGELSCHRFREWEDLSKFDAVVFWGDWQTHPKYGAEDYPHAEAKYEGNRIADDAIRRWRSIYQLKASLRGDQRPMLSIGCSFIGADAALHDAATREAFSAYVNRSDLVIQRDPLSYDILKRLFPDTKTIMADGIDPALLAAPLFARSNERSGKFAYCFDRELKPFERRLVALVQELSGARPVYVDWNKRRFPKRLRHNNFVANLKTIAEADFCITDLYHLTANAINLQVPVISCGKSQASATVTTNSEKKLQLMAQFGLQDFYIDASSEMVPNLKMALAGVHDEHLRHRLRLIQGSLISHRNYMTTVVREHLSMRGQVSLVA